MPKGSDEPSVGAGKGGKKKPGKFRSVRQRKRPKGKNEVQVMEHLAKRTRQAWER